MSDAPVRMASIIIMENNSQYTSRISVSERDAVLLSVEVLS